MGRLHFRFTQDIIVVVALVILVTPRQILGPIPAESNTVFPVFPHSSTGLSGLLYKELQRLKSLVSLPKPLHAGTPRRGYIFHLIAEVLWHRLASVGSDLNIREVCS